MRLRHAITLLLALAGIWQVGGGLYIPAKAWLAQQLIHRAWVSAQADGSAQPPWAWADTVPVARLVAPEHDEDFIVLSGASGEALAFGPGHVTASGAPGSDGHIVIGGHRDTHFSFLEQVTTGQLLQLHSRDGLVHNYIIESVSIADITTQPLLLVEQEPQLTLVTCYPFDGLSPGNNLRFVVTARRSSQPQGSWMSVM